MLRGVLDRITEQIGIRGGAPVGAGILPRGLAATGRQAIARALSLINLAQYRRWGPVRLLSQALVVEATLAPEHAGELLGEAVRALEVSRSGLIWRALIAQGSPAPRRERRAARPLLTRGLDLATRCGAQPLVEEATSELLASGARPQRQLSSGVESLTPSELRVATLAAHGRTNAQTAQTLFVTRSTVETHLSAVYRKLDVRSHAELPERLRQ